MADSAGRIPRSVFIATTCALLGLCLLASAARFYIRIRLQKEIKLDDGFLVFGLCCLFSGIVLLFIVLDAMYEAEWFVYGQFNPLTDNLQTSISQSSWYRKISTAALSLFWVSICAAKFSFLALFRRLIRQMTPMIKYWWFTLAFNIVISGYGAVVYLVTCPYYSEAQMSQAMQCAKGDMLALALKYSISQMVLDITGDLFILFIPIILIWKIRIHWTQKIALSFTLCLTVFMIAITITRIVGLQWKGRLDSVWETYFIVIGAELGLTLVAITAFREFFVSKLKNRHAPDANKTFNWYRKGRSTLVDVINKATGKTNPDNVEMDNRDRRFIGNDIPHATITGVRSFIDQNGRSKISSPLVEEV